MKFLVSLYWIVVILGMGGEGLVVVEWDVCCLVGIQSYFWVKEIRYRSVYFLVVL